jgi:hypothetical protein
MYERVIYELPIRPHLVASLKIIQDDGINGEVVITQEALERANYFITGDFNQFFDNKR